jgi:cytochrome c oxidase assembly factor CtaG
VHDSGLSPLTWSSLLTTWRLEPGWLVACALLAIAYLNARRRSGRRSTVRPWRGVAFVLGCVSLWATVASGVGAYAMSVFWMHMVLHLTLIMIVPALLVLGHPLTVVVEGPSYRGCPPLLRAALSSRLSGVLTHPLTGLVVYTATIIGTHLTGFMDQMARHDWLMTGEQVLYVAAGWWFLLPLIGEEPIRYRPPYLLRMVLLVAAMVPDTIVGIVLLQSSSVPFPAMMAAHPTWAPAALDDVQIGGGLMWAAGDGLMMAIAVALMISVICSPDRQRLLLGSWLERVRAAAVGTGIDDGPGIDSEASREAYNRRLSRLEDATR